MNKDTKMTKDMHTRDAKGGITNGKLMEEMRAGTNDTLEFTIKQLEKEGYPQEVIDFYKKGRR